MMRILAGILLLQLLAQASGVVYVVDDPACEQPASEQEGDDCSPGCEDCLCCPHHRTLLRHAGPGATLLLETRAAAFLGLPALKNDPDLDEIMHVPKTGLDAQSFLRA